jgi:hypothetical protein
VLLPQQVKKSTPVRVLNEAASQASAGRNKLACNALARIPQQKSLKEEGIHFR